MSQEMTSKERWLAAIQMRPVDRLPFWPKLDVAYPLHRRGQFRGMGLQDIQGWIGSDKHIGIASCVREQRVKTSVELDASDHVRRTIYRTFYGETQLICRFDTPSQSWHPVEFPVKGVEDIKLMTEIYEDATAVLARDDLAQAKERAREIGQDALVVTSIGESPLMYWVEWLAGVQGAHYLMWDHPNEVEALFAALHRLLMEKARLLAESTPADALYMIENTSTTLISPEQYQRYCRRHISAYGEIVHDAGKPLLLHMCGHLKALLPILAELPARGFEAFTSPPLGNTRLVDGRTRCPDTCLIGGTNATLWTRSSDEIIAQLETDLDALPHHRGLVVTSAGVMPPMCEPETIKTVCEWVKRYPACTA